MQKHLCVKVFGRNRLIDMPPNVHENKLANGQFGAECTKQSAPYQMETMIEKMALEKP